jgi:hypothetical protein
MDVALSDVSAAAAGQILRFSLLISLLAGNEDAETGSIATASATTQSRANRDFPVHRKRGLWTEATRGRWGLFHADPKRIVRVLRVTLLNRLNNSREWAELPLARQTLHHDRLSDYRGLQTPLFILSLGIELAHSFNLNVSG